MNKDPRSTVYESIAGGSELLQWFGRVPSFHDAEILSLSLCRDGPSHLALRGWNITDTVRPDGYFVLDRRAVVTFVIEGITDLKLEGFNHQNVIYELGLSRISPDSPLGDPPTGPATEFELSLEGCYGLSGVIRARKISVGFVPSTS